jgi:predicted DNA-binding transcriptional regulator YafY
VTTRAIRNDMGRLRRLGYPVDGRPGVALRYRLGLTGGLPLLLLDDEAVVVGLRTAASRFIGGIEETSVRALAKLQRAMDTATSSSGRLPAANAQLEIERRSLSYFLQVQGGGADCVGWRREPRGLRRWTVIRSTASDRRP